MGENLQALLDNCSEGQEVLLPLGEYEGPLVISKPCRVVGNATTLWAKKGPVLLIRSGRVTLKNLRLEITDETARRDELVSIVSDVPDTVLQNVEVTGNIKGIPEESGDWQLPRLLDLGKFKAEAINTFTFDAEVPAEAKLSTTVKDVTISPSILKPGKNSIIIETKPIRPESFLYGDILVESTVRHRIFVTGQANGNLSKRIEHKVISTPIVSEQSAPHVVTPSKGMIVPEFSQMGSGQILQKGQRGFVKDICEDTVTIQLTYEPVVADLEIDTYTFLLDENQQCKGDDDLVFFGHLESNDQAVKYMGNQNNKNVIIDFAKVSTVVKKISIGYAIYGDNASYHFSKVKNPVIHIQSKQMETARFAIEGLLMEKTIVAIEFYRYKNEWKYCAIGSGYKEGLKRLCESFGLTVE